MDDLEIPTDFNFMAVAALSHESREKLSRMRPATLGQAGRIDGVRAGDLAVLSVLFRESGRRGPTPKRQGRTASPLRCLQSPAFGWAEPPGSERAFRYAKPHVDDEGSMC